MSIFPPHVPALCGNVLALVEAALAALAAGPSSNQASPAAGEPKTRQHSDQRYEAGCQEVPIRDVGRVDRHHRRGPLWCIRCNRSGPSRRFCGILACLFFPLLLCFHFCLELFPPLLLLEVELASFRQDQGKRQPLALGESPGGSLLVNDTAIHRAQDQAGRCTDPHCICAHAERHVNTLFARVGNIRIIDVHLHDSFVVWLGGHVSGDSLFSDLGLELQAAGNLLWATVLRKLAIPFSRWNLVRQISSFL
mmetsp:Transcript_4462/g.9150  ORF Transcript_4462/g.9150 Transcript_4462/m.9150 type:complete len:251 (-) Transcript_4462:413-1165(-)